MKPIDIKSIESAGYKITSSGYVIGKKSGLKLKADKTSDGYQKVSLKISGEKETYRVHRLVAKKFIPSREGCDEVNHKDGNRENNSVLNLEWVSRAENNFHKAHGDWTKRNSLKAKCFELLAQGKTMIEVASRLGVSASTVHRWNKTV